MGALRDEIQLVLGSGVDSDGHHSVRAVPPHISGLYGLAVTVDRSTVGAKQAARSIADRVNRRPERHFVAARADGRYVNFTLASPSVIPELLERQAARPARKPRKALLEVSPPNIGLDPSGVHFRAACLSRHLMLTHRLLGDDAHIVLFWNDCGTPAGLALKRVWPHEATARELGRLVEAEDPAVVAAWQHECAECLSRIEELYRRWSVPTREVVRESESIRDTPLLLRHLDRVGLTRTDPDGSVAVVFDDPALPSRVLIRSDGASLYLARDLARLERRSATSVDLNVYVVSKNQELHFQQLLWLGRRLSVDLAERSVHAGFGLVRPRDATFEQLVDLVDTGVHGDSGDELLRMAVLARRRAADVHVDPDQGRQARHRLRALRGVLCLETPLPAQRAPDRPLARCELRLVRLLDERWDVLQRTVDRQDPSEHIGFALRVAAAANDVAGLLHDLSSSHREMLMQHARDVVAQALVCAGLEAAPRDGRS